MNPAEREAWLAAAISSTTFPRGRNAIDSGGGRGVGASTRAARSGSGSSAITSAKDGRHGENARMPGATAVPRRRARRNALDLAAVLSLTSRL